MTTTRESHVVIREVGFDEGGMENVVDFPVVREFQMDIVSFREEFCNLKWSRPFRLKFGLDRSPRIDVGHGEKYLLTNRVRWRGATFSVRVSFLGFTSMNQVFSCQVLNSKHVVQEFVSCWY